MLVVWSIVMLANGVVNVAEVFLAKESYGRATSASGCSGRGRGSASIVGGLAAAPLIERDLGTAYVRFLAVFAVGTGCAAVAPNVWVGIAAMVLAGSGTAERSSPTSRLSSAARPTGCAGAPSRC